MLKHIYKIISNKRTWLLRWVGGGGGVVSGAARRRKENHQPQRNRIICSHDCCINIHTYISYYMFLGI